jgi:integrase
MERPSGDAFRGNSPEITEVRPIMPRRPFNDTRVPSYQLHRSSGHARVRIAGKDHWLGQHGTPESRARYDALVAEWLARGRAAPPPRSEEEATPSPTVAEVVAAFWNHAEAYYRNPDGTPGREQDNFRASLRPVTRLYGDDPAASFGPLKLRAVRGEMVRSGLSRQTVNSRVNRIRAAFKWAASHELVPPGVVEALRCVDGLRPGLSGVRESPPIDVVDPALVEATLPLLPEPVAAMVRLMLLTGMRVGEVLIMRTADVAIDPDDAGGTYTPSRHKNAWRGQNRAVALGPRALEVLRPFLRPDAPEAFLFTPKDVVRKLRKAGKGGKRPSLAADRYNRMTLRQAVERACDRAFRHPTLASVPRRKLTTDQAAELKAWRKAHRWTPLQLRKTAAQMIRDRFGLEGAASVLGHAKPDVTADHYARRADAMAAEIARKLG